jgi:hypothetical protein
MDTRATLESVPVTVTPGGASTCRLVLRNNSYLVEAYEFSIVGDAAAWSRVDPPSATLYPGGESTVDVHFEPPRSPLVPAGEVPFAVRVVPSGRLHESVAPEGVVDVQPYTETTAELIPRTSRGMRNARHEVAVDNMGNVPIAVSITGVDPDGRVTATPRPDVLTVAPGQVAFTTLVVRSRRRLWRGAPVTHPFRVLVACEGQQPAVLDGATLQTPLIPAGAGRVAASLIALALVLAGGWYLVIGPATRSAAKEAVREPLQQVARQADAAHEKADTADRKAEAVANRPTDADDGANQATADQASRTPTLIRLTTALAPGPAASTQSYKVPNQTTLIVSDLVLQNPQGDAGRVDVLVDGAAVLILALANFRVLDLHFASPIHVAAGKTLAVRTTCQTPGTQLPGTSGSQCRVWTLASGVRESPIA